MTGSEIPTETPGLPPSTGSGQRFDRLRERTIASVRLAHQVTGGGPPLLLIMGINAPGSAWQPHVEAWAAEFSCIVVDNRGTDASPAPPGVWTTEELADDYAELIKELGRPACRVVGISMGGAVAQQLALRHPGLVDRLVLVASWHRPDPYPAAVLGSIREARRRFPPEDFSEFLQTLVWTPEWFRQHHDQLRAARSDPIAVPPDALAAQISACLSHDVADRLAHVAAPTLVTAGRADRFIPYQLSREQAEAIPDATFELFDTGHVHHWEELDRFNDLVLEWLR